MARSLFRFPGFITKEKNSSIEERTGPGFSAFKASAYQPAQKNVTSDVISSQPIACPSDQQADHVTHRPTSVSKNSSQGLSQQLSNLQIRRAIESNALINGGNLQ